MTDSKDAAIRWSVDADAPHSAPRERLLVAEALIPLPREEVFEFFAAAENLERITPPALRFRITTALPIRMGRGTLIDYTLRLHGIPFRWRTEITEWTPPVSFTDTQLRGPYHTWIHQHSFHEAGDGTVMRDEVRYRLPMGPLGGIVLPLVRRRIEAIFRYRQETIGELLLTR